MYNTIYFINVDISISKIVVIELRKEFDEEYDDMLYIGADIEGLYGYYVYEIELDQPIFHTDVNYHYFTINRESIEKSIIQFDTFEFYSAMS